MLDKHKVDGIYTSKIIEKAVPKKFRTEDNVSKVKEFLKNNNINIISEAEAKALIKSAKNANRLTFRGGGGRQGGGGTFFNRLTTLPKPVDIPPLPPARGRWPDGLPAHGEEMTSDLCAAPAQE